MALKDTGDLKISSLGCLIKDGDDVFKMFLRCFRNMYSFFNTETFQMLESHFNIFLKFEYW